MFFNTHFNLMHFKKLFINLFSGSAILLLNLSVNAEVIESMEYKYPEMAKQKAWPSIETNLNQLGENTALEKTGSKLPELVE